MRRLRRRSGSPWLRAPGGFSHSVFAGFWAGFGGSLGECLDGVWADLLDFLRLGFWSLLGGFGCLFWIEFEGF